MSKDLPEMPGREVLVITVEYPPGGADPIHRHNAHGFIYVLEGSVLMQVEGGKETTCDRTTAAPGRATCTSSARRTASAFRAGPAELVQRLQLERGGEYV